MRNFQEKSKWKKFLQSKPVLVVLTILLLLFIWNLIGLSIKLADTYKNKKIEQEKISDLKFRKEKLTKDIEKLNTNEGKEEVIRENFGMVKDGENVIVVIDDKNTNEIEVKPKTGGILNFFRNLFK